ncbi:uncharacterized protein MONOS_7466 [Monocercomonoides exilis]|uniref:uncharacterized protein n=1 Tax=Monocercomonoides exilis TaxID=2049356 RepID=UPI003559DA44|nr:hypothetical protein MONOS_7466 [Monocercomonoides exilis]|eukprot:MONOS_7466.1-p1 / transcript=MONOS_7466.1 / gene=MONOS_7466 / organism=Monocercomonoides_exilis_PA203 / gene_product=unspecified product / transcript_product=unspecified product / location=Mono_scaffold00256:2006-3414(-) / protein_length=354 / sequence_SO=supercontig / SO=protein_coding / is_pseudo=false
MELSYGEVGKEFKQILSLILTYNNDYAMKTAKDMAPIFDRHVGKTVPKVKTISNQIRKIDENEDYTSPIVMSAIPVVQQNVNAIGKEIDAFLKSRTSTLNNQLQQLEKEKREFDQSIDLQESLETEIHKAESQKLLLQLRQMHALHQQSSLAPMNVMQPLASPISPLSQASNSAKGSSISSKIGDKHSPKKTTEKPKSQIQMGKKEKASQLVHGKAKKENSTAAVEEFHGQFGEEEKEEEEEDDMDAAMSPVFEFSHPEEEELEVEEVEEDAHQEDEDGQVEEAENEEVKEKEVEEEKKTIQEITPSTASDDTTSGVSSGKGADETQAVAEVVETKHSKLEIIEGEEKEEPEE